MPRTRKQRLAIVGAGPKAAAVCAKAACLRDIFELDIEVTVFEKDALAAAWDGKHGFSDGDQRLCTPAERDLGFPYSDVFGTVVSDEMQRRFSWSSFAVSRGLYADWVDRGRPPPTHAAFAAYVASGIKVSRAVVRHGEVLHAALSRGRWSIDWKSGSTKTTDGPFDGVVVTGTGPAARKLPTVVDPRILDGVSFWRSRTFVRGAVRSASQPVVIVGSGGTAAAIAAKLIKDHPDTGIVILGTQVALYARLENLFENRIFRDTATWKSLSADDRRAFTDRLTRGAVWSSVIEVLSNATNLSYRPGRALGVAHEVWNNPASDLLVEFETSAFPGSSDYQPACLVVDATGFDPMWFTALLDVRLRDAIRQRERSMRARMTPSLSLPLPLRGRLHAPTISQAVSPAFTSLMALGAMSDAILVPYVQALMP